MGDGSYRGTSTDFTDEVIDQFRQDVLASPSLGKTGFGQWQLLKISNRLDVICDNLTASAKAYGDTHQGKASEAAQNYLARLVLPGLDGRERLSGLANSMRSQTDSFATLYHEMETAGKSSFLVFETYYIGAAREDAKPHANAYETGTNDNISRSLPVFDPPPAASVSSQVIAPASLPGGGSAGARLAAADGGLAPASPGVPTEVAGMPAAAGGAGSGGVAGPGGPGGSAASGSMPMSPAEVGRSGSGVVPVLPGVSGLPGGAGSGASGGLPGAAGRWGGVEALGPRNSSTPGVIRPDLPRGAGPAGEPAPRGRLGERMVASEEQVRSNGARGSNQAGGHQPVMPGTAGAGGRGGSSRRRPEWLIEPDPDSYWLSDVPAHGPAVIRPGDPDELDD